jgi:glycosyltransferase involved in cell wall biosynthesis
MIAAYFHDERFTRDASGTYYSAAVPYEALARYLEHFDRIVVVGRLGMPQRTTRTVASGERVEWACVETSDISPRSLPAVLRGIREALARVDCAIVHMPGIIGPMACREAARSGTPWMIEVVGDVFESLWHHGSLRAKAAAVPLHLLNRRYIGQAPFAIYVTATTTRRYPPGGTWVAASDVVIDPPREDVLRARIARIDASPWRHRVTLGLVGSYDVNYKGHEVALRALALLRRSGRPITLRCIGVGDARRWRTRAAALGVEGSVELGDALPHASILAWMDELDVIIVPSLTEGLPRALVEAMSRALPAVGSRTGGIPELLAESCTYRPGDYRTLASLVGGLLDRREQMKAEARRNWQTASHYSADVLRARSDGLVRQFRAAVLAQARREAGPDAPPAAGA